MYVLFYDTETTGIPLFEKPSADPAQPRVVQFAARMVNAKTRDVVVEMNNLIKPDGWTLPAEVATITGLTQEKLEAEGKPIMSVVGELLMMLTCRPLLVGHNESFDRRMVRIELKRCATDELADEWKAMKGYDTCKESRAIINLPKTKAPTLEEAHRHFFGPTDYKPHNALADMNATMELYWALMDKKPKFDKYAALRT